MEKIKAMFIFEILGRPPEHIKETLEKLVEEIDKQQGFKILNKKIHEPHQLERKNEKGEEEKVENMFTSFAEVEIEMGNINLLFSLVYNFLPSSVEISKPAELRLKNFDLSALLGEIIAKLHKYDEIAKFSLIEREKLLAKIKELEESKDSKEDKK